MIKNQNIEHYGCFPESKERMDGKDQISTNESLTYFRI